MKNPQPRKRGNMICLWYDSKTNIPRIAIGPDWKFSLVKLVTVQALSLTVMINCFMKEYNAFGALCVIMYLIENASFLLTILQNPGMAQRDVSIHSKSYLNIVKTSEIYNYCRFCKVIHRKDVPTEHCPDCGVCIEGLDHHCPWSSKCIGSGNIKAFYAFLFSFTIQLVLNLVVAFIIFGANENYDSYASAKKAAARSGH